MSKLKRYLSKKNIVQTIRNRFVAHYGREIDVEKAIEQTPDSERLEMFISEHRGNCLYSFADVILGWDILQSVDSSDPQLAMKTLVEEIVRVSGWFQDFGSECLLIIGKEADLAHEEIEIDQPPVLSDVRLPYFVGRSG